MKYGVFPPSLYEDIPMQSSFLPGMLLNQWGKNFAVFIVGADLCIYPNFKVSGLTTYLWNAYAILMGAMLV